MTYFSLYRSKTATKYKTQKIFLPNFSCPEKKRTNSILGITSSNTDRFTKCFHFYNLLEICSKAVVKYPIAPKTRHYTTHFLTSVFHKVV